MPDTGIIESLARGHQFMEQAIAQSDKNMVAQYDSFLKQTENFDKLVEKMKRSLESYDKSVDKRKSRHGKALTRNEEFAAAWKAADGDKGDTLDGAGQPAPSI